MSKKIIIGLVVCAIIVQAVIFSLVYKFNQTLSML